MQFISVIYHYTRCGSTALTDAINNHPKIHSMGEILNPKTTYGKMLFGENYDSNSNKKTILTTDLLNIINQVRIQQSGRHLCFELTAYDFYMKRINCDLIELLKILEEKWPLKVIHLIRYNLVERYLSSEVAAKTELWHLQNGKTYEKKPIELEIDVTKIKSAMWSNALSIMRNKCLLEKFKPLDLEYEIDIRDDVNIGARKYFDSIGEHRIEVHSNYRKLPHISERVKNWSNVKTILDEAGLGDFITDM